jgi:hypothetical protein
LIFDDLEVNAVGETFIEQIVCHKYSIQQQRQNVLVSSATTYPIAAMFESQFSFDAEDAPTKVA